MPSVSVAAASARVRKLRLLPLIATTFFMVSGGPYGIEDILGGAGYGVALLILLLLPLFWSVPVALMVGELATALPDEGGFYVWVHRAVGPFWGFQEVWLSLTASIFDMAIYPTLSILYLGRIAPSWTSGHRGALWALVVIAACCALNLSGAFSVGQGSVLLSAALLAPFVILTIAGLARGLHAPHALAPLFHSHAGNLTDALLVAMWNYMGWDNASTVAQEVHQPQRTYPRAVFATVAVVAAGYTLPLAAAAVAGVPSAEFSTGSWVVVARTLVGPALGVAVVLGGIANGFGMFNALVLSYTRLPMVLAEEGVLPRCVAWRNRRGAPWVAILLCAGAWALALGLSFERLISLDLMLYGASLVLEFVALAVLRRREPNLARPFRVPGGLAFVSLLGAIPTALIFYALWASRADRIGHLPAWIFGLLVAGAGPAVYLVVRRHRRQLVHLPC
jgi:amino acid transporter